MIFFKKKKLDQKMKEVEFYSFLTTLCMELSYNRNIRKRVLFDCLAYKFHGYEKDAQEEVNKLLGRPSNYLDSCKYEKTKVEY